MSQQGAPFGRQGASGGRRVVPQPTRGERPVPFYSLQGIGTAICWVSGLALLPLGIAIVAEFQQAALMAEWIDRPSLIDQSSFRSDWLSAEDTDGVASIFMLLLGLSAFVLLVIWSWRASKNVQKWGEQSGRGVRRGAGWAIGGWFIPIGNFWIPYQTIQDAWRRAPLPDGSWQRYDDPQRNNAWLISWLTWVATNLLSRLVIRNWLSDETPREFRTTYFLDAFSNLLLAVSVISLIIAVKQISDRHALHRPSFP